MTKEKEKFLTLLAEKYPNKQKASEEIINLKGILSLPKGTEHFVSDIHGEYEAFKHLLNNGSGVIREKIEELFKDELTEEEISAFATLIYYPEAKIEKVKISESNMNLWYETRLRLLIELCKYVSSKYTRSKVRKAIPEDFQYGINELLHCDTKDKEVYYKEMLSTIIETDMAGLYIQVLCNLIKRLAVDRLHIVGDIYDRGPAADDIMDLLIDYHSVDIQWGNHDIQWMGAAAGSEALILSVLYNSLRYGNINILEEGYHINLRVLSDFAHKTYVYDPVFKPKEYKDKEDVELLAKMNKAIAIMMFKVEGQIIKRHPNYYMEERLLLHRINWKTHEIEIEGKTYRVKDTNFPTVDKNDPYALSEEEGVVLKSLVRSFKNSERLQTHVDFIFENGSLYKCYNGNLLFHGCIPLTESGEFQTVYIAGVPYSGRNLMDRANERILEAYYTEGESEEKTKALDFMWYMWCGRYSPLFGRSKMATFENLLIGDEGLRKEPKNPYYELVHQEEIATKVLREFGLKGPMTHIINGHIPVKAKKGESPIKANGKMIIIDGGFCKSYHNQTGIAGYTLIYSSDRLRLAAHEAFETTEKAIEKNRDILSNIKVFERADKRITVRETDDGQKIKKQIRDLKELLSAYKTGKIKPKA